MTDLQIGITGTLALFSAMWVLSTEIRIRQVQSKLLVSEEKNVDFQIKQKTSNMLDPERESELVKNLRGQDTTNPST